MAKRVAVLAVALTAGALVLFGLRPEVPLGILLGGFAGVYKLRVNSRLLREAAGTSGGSGIAVQVLLQFVAFGLLLAVALVDVRLFAGVAAGLLLVPAVICVNAVTERLGLTRNRWCSSGGTGDGFYW